MTTLTRYCAALAVPILFLETSRAADWPLFRGNALQTGVASANLPDNLAVRWKFEAKDGFENSAAIVADIVFIASLDKHLYALDLATGQEKWRYKAGPFKASPSVRDGAVYVGDLDGLFHCVDAKTGRKKWTYEVGAEITSGANFSGNRILFGCGDEHLYCLSSDGKLIWKFRVQGGPVQGSPAIVGERTFVAGCDSSLHVVDLTTGKELTSVDLEGQVGASAAVVGEQFYVGTMSNQVVAIDWKKSSVLWRFEAKKRQQPFGGAVAATDSLILAGSRDKRVYAVDRKSGQETWSFPTEGRIDSSPVVVGKRVYVGSLDGKLYVLDLARGTELHKFDLGSPVSGSPAVGGDSLVIGTDKGVLYCFGAKN